MYCIAVLIDEEQKGAGLCRIYFELLCRQKDISPGSDLSGSGKVFWRDTKDGTSYCASGASGGSRAECCRASSFPAPQMQK